MSAESKGQKIGSQRGDRACRTFAGVARRIGVCKSERLECLGVGVVSVIVV